MANPSKRKGTEWESTVVTYLRDHGFPFAERRALSGNLDKGDITGVPGVMLECKDVASITLSTFMQEVQVQKANAGAQVGAAIIKRRRKGVAEAYVVMPLHQFVELIT